MASFATMSLNDGQTTPVSHSFTKGATRALPDGRLYFSWADYSVNGGIPIGANRIEMYVRLPVYARSKKAGDSKLTLAVDYKVTVPTLETLSNNTASGINPQPTHAFDTAFWGKVVRNGRAGDSAVKDALAFQRNFSQNAQFTDTALLFSPPSA